MVYDKYVYDLYLNKDVKLKLDLVVCLEVRLVMKGYCYGIFD